MFSWRARYPSSEVPTKPVPTEGPFRETLRVSLQTLQALSCAVMDKVAILYPFSRFCEIYVSLLSLEKHPTTAPNLFQSGVESGQFGGSGTFGGARFFVRRDFGRWLAFCSGSVRRDSGAGSLSVEAALGGTFCSPFAGT